MNDIAGYLAVLADSDLFGWLSLISFSVAMLGLRPQIRKSTGYQVVAFACLLFMPVLHIAGTFFLNKVSS